MKTSSSRRGFTLIELLTVIAIIGVLAALLFPAIKSALLKAEKSKAQFAISSGLAHAFQAYYTEYGKWPIAYVSPTPIPPQYEDFVVDKYLVALLSGDDVGFTSLTYPAPASSWPPAVDAGSGPPYGTSVALYQGNPRKTVFLEFKNKDLDTSAGLTKGYFIDPWGRHYHFRLDVNYQSQITYPFSLPQVPGTPVNTVGFLIWSVGPDGAYDRTDTILTFPPQPLTVTTSAKNRDNVISW